MTEEELALILAGEEMMKVLDVKTLVLDIVRDMSSEELLSIFWKKLPGLSQDYVKDYLYMRRP